MREKGCGEKGGEKGCGEKGSEKGGKKGGGEKGERREVRRIKVSPPYRRGRG